MDYAEIEEQQKRVAKIKGELKEVNAEIKKDADNAIKEKQEKENELEKMCSEWNKRRFQKEIEEEKRVYSDAQKAGRRRKPRRKSKKKSNRRRRKSAKKGRKSRRRKTAKKSRKSRRRRR